MTIADEHLKDLSARRERALAGGGVDKLEARHKKGQLGARERIVELVQQGTFQEFGLHAQHQGHEFGMAGRSLPADAVVTGVGYLDGRPVAAFSQDFTVAGGSLGRIHARKICDLMEYALRAGMPIVGFNDSGGARIQEAVESLSGYGQVFFRNVLLSGVIPQIAVIAGPCAGGGAYSPALMDFIIMTKQSRMFICGPDVIKAATGQEVTTDDIGGPAVHATVSGNAHFVAEDDRHANEIVRKLLSFLPANNVVDPPHRTTVEIDMADDPVMNDLVPDAARDPLDAEKVILRLVDDSDFLEVHKEFARNLIVGFGRIQGVVVGIVANQSLVKAGTLDIDAADKGARFIRFCNCFNIPIVNLVDVPGFLPGIQQEKGGIIRHGAKMLFAYGASTVPKITLIMRKAYGGAYLAMCSQDMGADVVFAWPTAEIAVMGAEGAVNVLYKKEIDSSTTPAARRKELIDDYQKRFASPYQAASLAMVADVIEPAKTRATIALALRSVLSKRETRPPKKHGNIPL